MPKKTPRVVLGTNVFVSGLISSARSPPVKLLKAVKDKKIVRLVSQDPDDDIFLQTAVDGDAAMLVTGDKADLLHFGEIQGIAIVSASEAIQPLRG